MANIKKNKLPFVSIIIPLHWGLKKENYQRFLSDFQSYLNLDYEDYEIVVVSDSKIKFPFQTSKIVLLNTPKKTFSPSEKRDFALSKVKGEICAFIDDDAYPDKKWLKNAAKDFSSKSIVAVGGPGLTPSEDSFWKKIGGYILESYLCSGGAQDRFYNKSKKESYVKDYPAYNLLIRTEVLRKVGGFRSTFYGGEDTFLCLRLIKEGLILYDPTVIVYHHRRDFPLAHFKQIANVGIHRGFFFKKYPETSRHFFYTLPSILTFGLITLLIFSFLDESFFFRQILFFILTIFLLAGTISVKSHGVPLVSSIISGFGIIATHIVYGVYFLKGLIIENLAN